MPKDDQKTSDTDISNLESARAVIDAEIAALKALGESLDEKFERAVDLILNAQDYVIVTGVGKSGHVGRKIAATLASTGSPSFFVHPTEASHGDLGMIKKASIILAISNSGETRELRDILLYCNRVGAAVIAITSRAQSFLATNALITLTLPHAAEACPNQVAPTSSTTMTMALGDALAISAMRKRGFTSDDFGLRHPGGAIGMRLQLISEWMALRKSPPNPVISDATPFVEILRAVSVGGCGAVSVVAEDGRLEGVITDGDIRRAVSGAQSPQRLTAREFLSHNPVTALATMRIGAVVEIFETRRISQVIVVEDAKPIAMIHVKDLMSEGYF
ncbi:MAG: KpsF/GutQ family sugar-phosphate isomerase [Pseudomonadota bacterium]